MPPAVIEVLEARMSKGVFTSYQLETLAAQELRPYQLASLCHAFCQRLVCDWKAAGRLRYAETSRRGRVVYEPVPEVVEKARLAA